MDAFDPIDKWFAKGFKIHKIDKPKRARIDAVRAKKQTENNSYGTGVVFSPQAKNVNIKSVINKAPEVVIKITGKSMGLKTLKNHIDYISRNGKLELLDENGNIINGRSELKELQKDLKMLGIPDEGKNREYLHVLFSMPKNTPEAAFKEAVTQFCKEEFNNRRYVMAFHDDTDHTHMHVAVGTRDLIRGVELRLSPRKDDLFRWRQGFADKLRSVGIEAGASERRHRFNYRKSENAIVRQIKDKTTKQPDVYKDLDAQITSALKKGLRPANPAFDKNMASKLEATQAWELVAQNLDKNGDVELANKVRKMLVEAEKPIVSRNQQLYDERKDKAIGQEIESEINL